MRKLGRVVIIGAGIGGLTAANALRRMGFEIEIYERSPALGEVGAGLQIGPNAVKVLRALGLEEGLSQVAAEPLTAVSVNWNDAALRFRKPMAGVMAETFGAKYYTTHRADLHALLARPVPDSAIHLSANCVSVSSTGDTATAIFDDGREVEADIIVGADGIRSVVRTTLFGAEEPRFTRQICWRCIVPWDCVPRHIGPNGGVEISPDEYVGWIGPNGHVICYPIRPGKLYNIFAGRVSDTADWPEESWTVESDLDEMLEAYSGWNEALLGMLRNVDRVYKWGLYDRDPIARWTEGRITLLGDAAHPMMPTLAQGAAQSIEDGYALARNLARHRENPVQGLAAYDAERVPRASRVQLQARQQFQNNQRVPAPPPLDRGWIFAHDATVDPTPEPAPTPEYTG